MAKEITSKKTKNTQIVSDDVWDRLVASGASKKYTMVTIPERKLPRIEPLITPKKPKEIIKTEKND